MVRFVEAPHVHDDGTMAAAAQPASSSFWITIGNEVVIFAMTVLLGLVFRSVSSHRIRINRKKAKTFTDQAASGPVVTSTCPPAAKPTARSESKGSSGAGAAAGVLLAHPVVSAPRSPVQMVELIFTCFKEQQGTKFAERAFATYKELRRHLRDRGVPLVQVAAEAKWDALDLYASLIRGAIRATKFHAVEGFLDDMVTFRVPRTLVFYEGVMKQLAGQHQYRLALRMHARLANDGLEPSDVTYSCLISFAVEVEQYDKALQLYEQLVEVAKPPIRACMMVLRVHAKRQDWQGALGTLRCMQKRGPAPDSLALNVVLATCVSVGELCQAEALLQEFMGFTPPVVDVVSFNTVLKGRARQGNVEAVSTILKRMQGMGVHPTVITFNTSMDGALRGGKLEQVWEFWSTMKEANLHADRFTCSILVRALARATTPERIEFVLCALCDVDGAGSGGRSGKGPGRSSSSRGSSPTGCQGGGDGGGAGWPDEGLRDSVYNSVFQAAVDTGSPQAISQALGHMREIGVAPIPSSRVLAQLRQHAADTTLCSQLWQDLHDAKGVLTPCAFSAMLDECMAHGRFEKAIAAFEELRTSRRASNTAERLDRRRSGSGSCSPFFAAAGDVSPSAGPVAPAQDGIVTECRARLMRCLCSVGRDQEAMKMYKQASADGELATLDAPTAELVARAQVAAGSLERAWSALEDQIALGRKLGEVVIRIFLASCLKQSNAQYARVLFRHATAGAVDLSPSAYVQLIQLHARRGESDDVLIVFEYMTKRAGFPPPPDVFPVTLRACLASMHPQRARGALETLRQLAPTMALDASFHTALSRVSLGSILNEAYGAHTPRGMTTANTMFCAAAVGAALPQSLQEARSIP